MNSKSIEPEVLGSTEKTNAQRSTFREESDTETSDETEMDKWMMEASDIPDALNTWSFIGFGIK